MVLHNRHFIVGIPSDVDITENGTSVATVLFNYLVRGMQFTYDLIRFPRVLGKILPNGTWTGVTGYLNRSEIDFAATAFQVKKEIHDAAHVSFPFDVDETVFVTKKTEYSPETLALFRTLSPNVWLSLLATTILFALVCFAWMKHRYTLEEIFFHVLAIGLNQEGDLVSRRAGGRLLLGTWMVGMALFTFCFKSVLLSILSCPPLQGVRTVPELAAAIRTGEYSAQRFTSDFAKITLANSPNEDIRTIGESILETPTLNPYDLEGKSLIEAFGLLPNKALVVSREMASFVEETAHISEDNLETNFWTIATRKDFCCKEEMNMLIHRFAAAGLGRKIYLAVKNAFIFYSYSAEKPDYGEKIRKITMTDLSATFIFFGCRTLSVGLRADH